MGSTVSETLGLHMEKTDARAGLVTRTGLSRDLTLLLMRAVIKIHR